MKRRKFLLLSGVGVVGALAAYIGGANLFVSVKRPNLANLKKYKGKKMKALILGASGMVGGEVLKACLECENIEQITAIVRRDLGVENAKLTQIIHSDFSDFSSLDLSSFDICFYCIGTYTGSVDESEFERIICGISGAFASQLKAQNPNIAYIHLSGAGADESESSKTLFARLFGKAENHLKSLNFGRLHIFRPGYIYPVVPRKEPNVFYSAMRVLYKPIFSHFKGSSTTSQILANAMLSVALLGGEKQIYENTDINEIGG